MTHVANPETELLERCRDGDVDAFEELYRAHAGKLYGLATRMVGSRGEAEDLLQDIFLLAYRRLDTFKGDAAVSTWLYRIAVNRCLDHLRSRGAKMAQAMTALDEGHAAHGSVDASSSAVHRVDLERAIARLPDGYRGRSSCMTSKDSSTGRSRCCSGCPRAHRSRRCTRHGSGSGHC